MSNIAKERSFASHFKSNRFSFKKGHIPWNKGLTKETDERVRTNANALKGRKISPSAFKKGKSHPMYGKHHTTDWKQKVSKALKGRKFDEERCQNISNGLKGHPVSKENRRNMSKGQKRRFQRPEEIEKLRENRLKQILPAKDTSIEVAMQKEMDRRGIVYEKHLTLYGCQPDIVIPDAKIIIQCDGDYWHNIPKVKERDRLQDCDFKAMGWKVYRFWGYEIRKSPKECVKKAIGGM